MQFAVKNAQVADRESLLGLSKYSLLQDWAFLLASSLRFRIRFWGFPRALIRDSLVASRRAAMRPEKKGSGDLFGARLDQIIKQLCCTNRLAHPHGWCHALV